VASGGGVEEWRGGGAAYPPLVLFNAHVDQSEILLIFSN